jgi:DNA-binding NtrC family response regulator
MSIEQLKKDFKILLVDDEQDFCQSLASIFSREGWNTFFQTDPKAVLAQLAESPVDLVILDRRMPGMDGINLLKLLKQRYPNIAVIMLSGHSDVDAIVEAMKYGATNFFVKPPNIPEVLLEVTRVAQKNSAAQLDPLHQMIAQDANMLQLQRDLVKAAPTTATILINGESGTGKEMAAELVHKNSSRSTKPFIKINCAAIAETLLDSELFGHEKGAFTGATQTHKGRFEQADTGTLFLDEIGDMSLATQAKVLRILQEQQFERVGGERTLSVDVRIVAATNKNLAELVEEGTFREDLYYRLAVIHFELPSLRERINDVIPLANHFVTQFAATYNKSISVITEQVERIFLRHRWPGNIRELKNCIERAVIFCEGEKVDVADLSNQYQNFDQVDSETLESAIETVNKTAILNALENSGWKKQEAAKALNINRRTLYNRMKKLGL